MNLSNKTGRKLQVFKRKEKIQRKPSPHFILIHVLSNSENVLNRSPHNMDTFLLSWRKVLSEQKNPPENLIFNLFFNIMGTKDSGRNPENIS